MLAVSGGVPASGVPRWPNDRVAAYLDCSMNRQAEIYVSTDIEADGPYPGPHSMLSLGSVAVWADGTVVGEFSVNLLELPEANPHPVTMEWWQRLPEAWHETRRDPESPETAMPRYADWLDDLPARPVFVGYPVAWDFGWVYSYLLRFAGRCPFGHSGIDIKTLAMAVLGQPYRDCNKAKFPAEWLDARADVPHVAIEDAREQASLFCRVLAQLRS
jgi:hypothetical protein